MKIKVKLYLPLALFTIAAVACVKNPGNGGDIGSTPETFKELKAPDGFAWKTTSDVVCNFSSVHDAKVYVSATENGDAFASFIAGPAVDVVKLNVPSDTDKLYVRYETSSGLSDAVPLAVSAGRVDYEVPGEAKQYAAVSTYPEESGVKSSLAPGAGNGYDGVIY